MIQLRSSHSLSLIGMPGAGKSTVGVLLAKALSRRFIDTDLALQQDCEAPLAEILLTRGLEGFCAAERQCILRLDCRQAVIATGGSVVYSAAAMERLKSLGPVVHLQAELGTLQARTGDLAARGVVMIGGGTLAELYAGRRELYERWADATVRCDGVGHQQVVERVLAAVGWQQ
jgi:shikimate kinase